MNAHYPESEAVSVRCGEVTPCRRRSDGPCSSQGDIESQAAPALRLCPPSRGAASPVFSRFRHPIAGLLAGAFALSCAVLIDGAQARDAAAERDLRPSFVPALTVSGNFLAAYVANASNDTVAAAAFYRRLFESDPENLGIVENAFIAFLADGDMEFAFRAAERIVNVSPDNGLAHLALAVRDLRGGRFSAARARLEEGGRGAAADLTATLLRAWSFAGAQSADEALATVERLAGEASFDIFREFHGGLIASFLGKQDEAETRLKAALERQPGALSIVDAYALHAVRAGRPEDAIAAYEAFSEIFPRHPVVVSNLASVRAGERLPRPVSSVAEGASEVLYGLGAAGASDSDNLVAIIYLRLALHLAPAHDMALVTLADVFERMERYAEAIEALERIPESSPLRASSEIQIGHALERLGRGEEATAHFEALLERSPEDVDTIIALANVLRTRQKFPEAAEVYTRAIDLIEEPDAGHWTLFFFRGASFERSKQWELAEVDLKRALELVPPTSPIGEAQVLNYLGYSWVDQGVNIDEAFKMLQRAIELSPRDGMIIDSLGWAYYRLGRYEDAVRELERAVELLPADPVINDHLGDAYWKVGRKLEARFQWRRALGNDPEPEEREKIERKLEVGLDEAENPTSNPTSAEGAAPAPSDGG
ncbi:MAG: tetratricopeptide repeat protein [Salinarimonadaceae bacterium]|nr:MAG: tetratricopeptide repeat protein [Salinarimonadaceae bacterium]